MKFISVVLLLLVPLVMLSADSLWMDEAQTAHFALQPDFHAWQAALIGTHQSERQMPLFVFSAWVCGQLIGTQEWQLRLPNLFYAWAAIGAMWLLGRRQKLMGLPLLFVVVPFFGFYINEARPYMLVLAASAWVLYGYVRFAEARGQDVRALAVFCVAGIIACAAHMLAVFLMGGLVAVLLYQGWRERWRLHSRHGLVLAASVLVLLPLAGYYLWTLLQGAGGSKIWQVGLGNVLYVVYELLGVSAFGPPKQLLRETLSAGQGLTSLLGILGPYVLGLAVSSALYGWLFFNMLCPGRAGSRLGRAPGADQADQKTPRPTDRMLLVAVALTCLALFAAAWLAKWPFWGRHLATIFPLVIYLIASAGRKVLWRCPASGQPTWFGVAFLVLLLAGGLNQRFNPACAKDDYRGAAALAKQALARDETVWWAADPKCAQYYGLSFPNAGSAGRLLLTEGLHTAALLGLPRPDKVLLSKPDVVDHPGTLRAFLTANRYQRVAHLSGFDVWGTAAAP